MTRKVLQEAQESEIEMDMTSMIDVVFLLLIFFMCATKFKIPEGSLRAFLPRDRGGQSSQDTITRGCRISMQMGTDGVVKVMVDETWVPTNPDYNGPFEDEFMVDAPDEGFILVHIEERKRNYSGLGAKGLPVIIDFHEKVPVRYVVQMLNLCHKADIEDLSFAAPELEYD